MLLSLMLGSLPVIAQEQSQESTVVESNIAVAESPTIEKPVLYSSPPALTVEQRLQLDWADANTNLSPILDKTTVGDVAGPVPGTESSFVEMSPNSGSPLAPGDPNIYISTQFGSIIPGGNKSNVMSSSTDGKGLKMFFTGNYFAANSVDKGHTWKYVNSYEDFPEFCCSQISLYDESRNIYLWLRMGFPDANGENVFKLSVDVNDPFNTSYWTYTFAPTGVNVSWTNQFWDSPHMQMGADYLYVSWNMFNQSGIWVRTVILRFPLDALAAGSGFSYNYYTNTDWFTFIPVSGAQHTMYFASNWDATGGAPFDSVGIWRWHEDATGLTYWTKTVPAWTTTGRGSIHCGSPNWLARGDMRLLTGARYEINSDGIAEPRQTGKTVLGWWWNVAEGSGFTYPYINGAAFYEDTMELLPGYLGRPYVYGSWCFAYPSFTPNDRGDLGGVFNYSTGPNYQIPIVAYTIADDFWHAPPGWSVYDAVISGAGPSDAQWGNYNTVRNYQSGSTWIAGTHYIPDTNNCSNCAVPLWIAFGRERDAADFRYSCQIFGACIPQVYRP